MVIKNRIKPFVQQLWLWRANKLWTWVESVLLTTLILLVCRFVNPQNPLYLNEAFPWPWLAGVMIVLQHGLGPGIVSGILLAVVAFFEQRHGAFSFTDLQSYLLSGLTLLLVCGVFSTTRVRRMINAEELLVYTNERLDSLSNSYYMLRLSYDYLEYNVITKPYTLRLVLKELQQMTAQHQGQLTQTICYPFLQVLAQFCSINSAGIYLYHKKKLDVEPVAQIGQMGVLDEHDPLIRQSLDSQTTSYISLTSLENVNECQYLVSVPMLSSDNVCLGFVVIKDMSFWTLNTETLTTLSVLIAYFVEEVTIINEIPAFFAAYPQCPSDFAKQLRKLTYLHKKLQIDSALCAVMVPQSFRPHNIIDNLKKQRRFPDTLWVLKMGDDDVLINLIPFTNAVGIQGYFNRIKDYIRITMGLSFTEEEIRMRSLQIVEHDPLKLIHYFMSFIEGKKE